MKQFFNRFFLLGILFMAASAFAVIALKPVDADDSVTFTIKNLGLNVKGGFKGLKGNIDWNEDSPDECKLNVTVAANTVNTGIDMRDNHLKSDDYFDVAKYPEIRFASSSITKSDGGYTMTGTLTMKSVTRTVSFPFTVSKKTEGYLFSGKFTINRRDFGVGGSSVTMGDNVDVSLNVLAK